MKKAHAFPLAIAILIAVIIGAIVFTDVASQVRQHNENMEQRANATYENYTYRSSHVGQGQMVGVPMPTDLRSDNVTVLVRNHLYVTGYEYTPKAIASDLKVNVPTVKEALWDLEDRGIVTSGYRTYMVIPQKHYVHTEHGDLPDKWYSPISGPFAFALFITLIAVVLTAIWGRYRGEGE